MADSEWRTVHFNYRIPEGVDWDEMETRMIEVLAEMIGCDHEHGDDRCPADWSASCGPIKDEDDDGRTNMRGRK